MQRLLGTALGKSIRHATKLRGTSGQALPGLVVERLFPRYFARMLSQLPEGVVIVTGTNGKTTTTKMIAELLAAHGKRVLTNPTGSNLTRGINSMLIHQASVNGKLPYDLAVLELDEAYARLFVRQVKPRWVVALNVTRDQLDRFGEVDTAARMIKETMAAATQGVVTNANDAQLNATSGDTPETSIHYFGVSDGLRAYFPSENELVTVDAVTPVQSPSLTPDVELHDFKGQHVTYKIDGKPYSATLQITGQHNYQNAAAALTVMRQLMPAVSPKDLLNTLAAIQPAFGRGEVFTLQNGSTLRLVLVKNPSGFRQALASYLPVQAPIMIAINDNIADGRDMSWLWDVDFSSLHGHTIAATTGKRAADMALRLHYDGLKVEEVQPDLAKALGRFCALPGDKILFTTYTAMLWLYKTLSDKAGKEL